MTKRKPATAPATADTTQGGRGPGIDEAQVQMLQGVMRDAGGGFDDLVTGFLQQVAQLLDDLAADVTNRDHQLLRQHAHSLRGGAVQMGAVKLAELARRLEHSEPPAVWDLASALLAESRLEAQLVRGYFLAAAAGS